MVTVGVDTVKFKRDFEVFKNQLQELLQQIAIKFTREFLIEVVSKTKLGDAQAYMELYKQREKEYGYRPIEGLAKGSWITELNNKSDVVEGLYDSTGQGKAVTTTFDTEMRNYKLGDTIYITNKLHYIELQADGDSALATAYARSILIFEKTVNQTNRVLTKNSLTPRGA
jgi:hypothetical protein